MADSIDLGTRSRSPSPEGDEEGLFGDDDEGPIRSDEEGNRGGANSGDEEDKKKKKKSTKPKGPVRRMLISEDILNGPKGLVKIEELFKDFQFRGKGREKEDLSRMLNIYEHWIHMMHPKHPFDQCLERIEFLGLKKKSVKTLIKRIRMGLISSADDKIDDRLDDDDDMENANPLEGNQGGFGSDDDLDIGMIDELEYGAEVGGTANTHRQTANEEEDLGIPDMDELEELEFEQVATETQKRNNVLSEDEMDLDLDEEDDDLNPTVMNLTKTQEDLLLSDSPLRQPSNPDVTEEIAINDVSVEASNVNMEVEKVRESGQEESITAVVIVADMENTEAALPNAKESQEDISNVGISDEVVEQPMDSGESASLEDTIVIEKEGNIG